MTMSCHDLDALLPAYVDGEFDPSEGAEVEAHLACCPGCRRTAHAQESLKRAVRRSMDPARLAPHALRVAVLARLDQESREQSPGPLQSAWGWLLGLQPRHVALFAAGAGVACWFVLGGLRHPLLQRESPPTPHLSIEDGVAMHARTLPLDYAASDVASVQRWLETRLDFGVHVPRFQRPAAAGVSGRLPAGLQPQLLGVRLSTLHTRSAAVLSYTVPEDQGRRVSLLIVDDPSPELPGQARRIADRDVWLSRARGYNVASWRSDEIVYSLISDLDEHDVLDLVQAAQTR